jgi:hypothetical protein
VVSASQQRPNPPYQGVLLSELTYYDTKPTDNYPNLPVYGNPYRNSYNPINSNIPSFSPYFGPYNSAYLNLYDLILNSDISKQLYASQLYPRLSPQQLGYVSQLQTSRLGLYPLLGLNGIIQQVNPFYNSWIGKIYNNLKNIRNGPVTVFVESKEDATQLDAIFVQQGLETLGKCMRRVARDISV